MSRNLFQAGGSLLSNSPVYLRREADILADDCLQKMQYITLIEGRQQGKTSLINRLMGEYSGYGYSFAVIDLMDFSSYKGSAEIWYGALGQRILSQLPFRFGNRRPKAPVGGDSWRDFLTHVSKIAMAKSHKVVIVLDEIGAMPQDWSTDFFTIIRSIYNYRQSQSFYQHITFIIAGVFDPVSLIKDPTVSGFNIDFRIPLYDFDKTQIRQLANHLDAPSDVIDAAAERIFYWTDGQPFLSQWLFFHISSQASSVTPSQISNIADTYVERFLREDRQHLRRIKELLASPELLDSITRLGAERLHPIFNENHFRLASVLGITKADSERPRQIRNRIYERALAEINTQSSQDEFQYDAFISYSSKDINWVHEKLLPSLEQNKLRICIDRRDFKIGTPSLVNMEEAVRKSRKVLLILTPNWVESEWTIFESLLIQVLDPIGHARHIVPVLVEKCLLPVRLKIFTHLDLTDAATFDSQMQRLINVISLDSGFSN
ncbi:MAG: TIR domain-containing protein [Blastocatellia bacterium]